MIREVIIKDLETALKPVATISIFEIYSFRAPNLPAVIIRDENDTIEIINSENLSHELNITLNLITKDYKQNDKLINDTLAILKDFKSKFIKKELNAINKSDVELGEFLGVKTEIEIKFTYITEFWSY
ncbi:hypothetical protein [Campylobacter hyointestinalis]|uniref:hypothetical protein n=1 Tax=Campylobacter hyointestinalis TaxID=198 RepID=UPI00072A62CD|nr:hypothetical protein [Campylobacter hyointestinalis]PPB63101.1 hypothetical protein CDQ72_01505 [Campylobacter hyointestinalis subsp. hyointestinalis]PPB65371.1 hypothetical protein CDQ73_01255 [Campylobacter hyointestinalis subsp. hyointestinalis]CUU72165.1 Uncharacterised protein [Campylobacter hyointestinalis subsp. hyointestinalis]